MIDVCTGAGAMALRLLETAPRGTSVHTSDFCGPMLDKAREKAANGLLHPVEADARALPFPDCHFDLATLSFATRNLHTSMGRMLESLGEIYRVLKKGGRLNNLETSQPRSSLVRKLYHLYVRAVVKPVGTALSGSKNAYAYLSSTIPVFYDAEEFSRILKQVGFTAVAVIPIFFGAIAIHKVLKEQ